MKSCALYLSFLLFCFMMSVQKEAQASCQEIVIGGHPDFAPLIWSDGQRMRGAGPDIARKIFNEMGVKVRYWGKQPYARIQRHLEMGQIDLVAGLAKNTLREQFTLFVEPPITRIVPYVFTDIDKVFHYFSWDQLKQLKGAAQLGVTFGTQFDSFAKQNLDIIFVDTTESALKLLARGRVDYVLQHYRRAQIEIDRLNYEDQIVALNQPLGGGEQDIHFGFSHRSSCRYLADDFSQRLKKYVDSGAVERLMDTYMWKFGVF